MSLRFILFGGVLIFMLYSMYTGMGELNEGDFNKSITEIDDPEQRFFLPTSNGQVVHHTNYSLSYIEKHEQAEWVAYSLTRDNLKKPNVKRSKRFNPDYDVKTSSAFHRDYTGSGYTRGHLAPAGDMAHDTKAMEESFYMSNMSPQLREFNNGVWKELEEQVRDWAFSANELYVVTGPILSKGIIAKIGNNKVSVPSLFYKILLDIEGNKEKSCAFLIPNEMCTLPLQEYAVSIDRIESLTGIDFFHEMLEDIEEEKLEKKIDLGGWKFSKKRFDLRVNKWNYQ